MRWTGEYRSPLAPIDPWRGRVYSDEELTTMVILMICGKDWDVSLVADGKLVMRQRPPHDKWEWEFTRLADA